MSDWPDEHGVVGDEGQKLAGGKLAPYGESNTEGNDDDHLREGDKVSETPVEAHDVAKVYPVVGKLLILCLFYLVIAEFLCIFFESENDRLCWIHRVGGTWNDRKRSTAHGKYTLAG